MVDIFKGWRALAAMFLIGAGLGWGAADWWNLPAQVYANRQDINEMRNVISDVRFFLRFTICTDEEKRSRYLRKELKCEEFKKR